MTPQTVQYKELSESGNHDREFGLCLLFIHPRAPNLISLSSFVFLDTKRVLRVGYGRISGLCVEGVCLR